MKLFDVINFNGDGSCLDSESWISALQGGQNSSLCRWLGLYVDLSKPVSIGFTGATLADIGAFNPEALTVLQKHPSIFQILLRPFAHDLPFFRSDRGFELNLDLGRRVATHLVGRVEPIYLPPEFMQTNRQTKLLLEHGVQATFVMGSRFKENVGSALPGTPFPLRGIPDGTMMCIPIPGPLTQAYLSTIQLLDIRIWQEAVGSLAEVVLWRDGESSFLVPDGMERERFWLESAGGERVHIDLSPILRREAGPASPHFGYPIHPFSAWMGEMRMLWFLQRVRELEQKVVRSPAPRAVARWLNCINSDILSSVEKSPPVVSIRSIDGKSISRFQIARSQRGFEGEALLEIAEKDQEIPDGTGWQKKALAREKIVCDLLR